MLVIQSMYFLNEYKTIMCQHLIGAYSIVTMYDENDILTIYPTES